MTHRYTSTTLGTVPPRMSEPEHGAYIPGSPQDGGLIDVSLISADALPGCEVINMDDESLGTIKEIMLDVQNGRIAYAILSAGGFLSIGERLFVVPWAALKLSPSQECFVLDVGKEQLKDAPEFDKGHWLNMPDTQWASQLHRFYRVHPYWE